MTRKPAPEFTLKSRLDVSRVTLPP
ncbi:hypothetical protein SEA_PERIWINKLE_38 [Gordonia phage Periwinkle]|nr:hypothetical protein SEA_PERIWINKLE_38 [Gordonia phage Periwinkle]